jgi:hypothetical protein
MLVSSRRAGAAASHGGGRITRRNEYCFHLFYMNVWQSAIDRVAAFLAGVAAR